MTGNSYILKKLDEHRERIETIEFNLQKIIDQLKQPIDDEKAR